MKLIQSVCLDEIKTMLLSQILENPCVHSRGHIFCPIIMELGENDFPNEISDKVKKLVISLKKTRSLG